MKTDPNGFYKICSTCEFHLALGDEPEDPTTRILECRKHAPTVISGSGTGWSDRLWPYVSYKDWCGDWELEQNLRV